MGSFFFRPCTGCHPGGCEDEGACVLVDGKCQEKLKAIEESIEEKLFEMEEEINIGSNNSCVSVADCWKAGGMCDGIQDVGCVCRRGQCKISCKLKVQYKAQNEKSCDISDP